MKILLLDNYDSFTHNLYHLVEKVSGIRPEVARNDELKIGQAAAYDRIILSPGPGLPSEAGIMPALLKHYWHKKPILGVCLGLQAIGVQAGGHLRNLGTVYHGVSVSVMVDNTDPLFARCPASFRVGRYHSWVIDENRLPPDLLVTARDEHGMVMAARVKDTNVCGIQFHPESILSENGDKIIEAWLDS